MRRRLNHSPWSSINRPVQIFLIPWVLLEWFSILLLHLNGDSFFQVCLAKESVGHLANTLARYLFVKTVLTHLVATHLLNYNSFFDFSNKLSAENSRVLVDVVRKLWGPGREFYRFHFLVYDNCFHDNPICMRQKILWYHSRGKPFLITFLKFLTKFGLVSYILPIQESIFFFAIWSSYVLASLWIRLLRACLLNCVSGVCLSRIFLVLFSECIFIHFNHTPFVNLNTMFIFPRINASDNFNEKNFNEVVNALKTSPPQSLTICLNGPHVGTLFATWPDSRINDGK